MEIIKTKLFGIETYAIFTGKQYMFNSVFSGVVCVANRTQESEVTEAFFDIVFDNNSLSSTDVRRIKTIITKIENRYITKDVHFNEQFTDMRKYHIDIESKEG
jgi:hypothetical protein